MGKRVTMIAFGFTFKCDELSCTKIITPHAYAQQGLRDWSAIYCIMVTLSAAFVPSAAIMSHIALVLVPLIDHYFKP